tara:strand:- start:1443 stop:1937 length:495 start_codon:yes stop_codon:yes gene_type:complete
MKQIGIHPIKTLYAQANIWVADYKLESESSEYAACTFTVNELRIMGRTAKITPKKVGQFVTFWKRNIQGLTAPFDTHDPFDYYVINVGKDERVGQFIIPKSVLMDKGIVSTDTKDGKRGFRVYPPWDAPTSKQAKKTQNWQSNYFVEFGTDGDIEWIRKHLRQP